MDKKDIFYYATAEGVPCYYQPETGMKAYSDYFMKQN